MKNTTLKNIVFDVIFFFELLTPYDKINIREGNVQKYENVKSRGERGVQRRVLTQGGGLKASVK